MGIFYGEVDLMEILVGILSILLSLTGSSYKILEIQFKKWIYY